MVVSCTSCTDSIRRVLLVPWVSNHATLFKELFRKFPHPAVTAVTSFATLSCCWHPSCLLPSLESLLLLVSCWIHSWADASALLTSMLLLASLLLLTSLLLQVFILFLAFFYWYCHYTVASIQNVAADNSNSPHCLLHSCSDPWLCT